MCLRCGCIREGCYGCTWKCKCDYKTWACYSNNIVRSCHGGEESLRFPYRNKYLCYPCRRVWKSYSTKYDVFSVNRSKSNCSKCRKRGLLIGQKFRVPKKNDNKAWNNIKEEYLSEYCPNFEKTKRIRKNNPRFDKNSVYKYDNILENKPKTFHYSIKNNIIKKKGWLKKLNRMNDVKRILILNKLKKISKDKKDKYYLWGFDTVGGINGPGAIIGPSNNLTFEEYKKQYKNKFIKY